MMNFHITDTFTDNFAKIIRRDQNAVKTTFKTEINEDDWTSPNSDTSQHLDKPKSGRIPVKVFDNFWDELKKAIRV
jgi:hypothetical protein